MSLATDGSPYPILLPASKITKYSKLPDCHMEVSFEKNVLCPIRLIKVCELYFESKEIAWKFRSTRDTSRIT